MKPTLLIPMLFIALAPIPAAQAQDGVGARLFQRLDANDDGTVTKEEAVAARGKLFARFDRDHDGTIGRDELEEARDAIMDAANMAQARLATAWRRMDADGNSQVSEDEFRTRTLLFDLADRNGDGKVSADEIELIRDFIAGRAG
jgi:Ca2+-binding EF-hand superfamily protein